MTDQDLLKKAEEDINMLNNSATNYGQIGDIDPTYTNIAY